LKKYFIQYKTFLVFIGTFFAAYIALTVVYKLYLNSFEKNAVDGLTNLVSIQVFQLMNLFNPEVLIFKNAFDPYLEVWYNQKYVVRIVEGCNAVSVIILFVSFVVAFSGKFKTTFIFILCGILFIHVFNVIRIASLIALLFYFPEQEHVLHGVIFPLIIYGLVFILWIIWVNKFSKYAR